MRANSQNIKNKNLITLNKKPLMSYTIKSAVNSKLFDNIVVSSDSKNSKVIKKVWRRSHILETKKIKHKLCS